MDKRDIRNRLRQARKKAAGLNPAASLSLRDIFVRELSFPQSSVCAVYLAQGSEMDVEPLARALAKRGHVLALPCVHGVRQKMVFRRYDEATAFELGLMGIPQPTPSTPEVAPDILLIPLVGFTHSGYRLGQGGGCYDMTLEALRQEKKITTIGVAFADQEVNDMPIEPHDQKMDLIVTEREIIWPQAVMNPEA